MNKKIKPRNRKEIFLSALAEGKAPDVEPRTREEKFLMEQAQRESKRISWNDLTDRPFGTDHYNVPIGKAAYNSENEYNATSANGNVFYYLGENDVFEGASYSLAFEETLEIKAMSEDIVFESGDVDRGAHRGKLCAGVFTYETNPDDGSELQCSYKYVYLNEHGLRDDGELPYLVYVPQDNVHVSEVSGGVTFPKIGSYVSVGRVSLGMYNPGDVYLKSSSYDIVTLLDEKYLPKAMPLADIADAPTAEDFNTLLYNLRLAGYLERN